MKISLSSLGNRLIRIMLIHIAVLLIVSWLAAALGFEVRSLLRSEALRWMLSGLSSFTLSHTAVALLMTVVALGALQHSGLTEALWHLLMHRSTYPVTLRLRRAFGLAALCALLYVGTWALLILWPHSPLLSVTGRLWPSPFSEALAPLAALGIVLTSAVFGRTSGRLQGGAETMRLLYVGLQLHAVWLCAATVIHAFTTMLHYAFG